MYASLRRNEQHAPSHNPTQSVTTASARLKTLAERWDSSPLVFCFFKGMWGSEDERHIIDISEVQDNISRASVALRLKCSDD